MRFFFFGENIKNMDVCMGGERGKTLSIVIDNIIHGPLRLDLISTVENKTPTVHSFNLNP